MVQTSTFFSEPTKLLKKMESQFCWHYLDVNFCANDGYAKEQNEQPLQIIVAKEGYAIYRIRVRVTA